MRPELAPVGVLNGSVLWVGDYIVQRERAEEVIPHLLALAVAIIFSYIYPVHENMSLLLAAGASTGSYHINAQRFMPRHLDGNIVMTNLVRCQSLVYALFAKFVGLLWFRLGWKCPQP